MTGGEANGSIGMEHSRLRKPAPETLCQSPAKLTWAPLVFSVTDAISLIPTVGAGDAHRNDSTKATMTDMNRTASVPPRRTPPATSEGDTAAGGAPPTRLPRANSHSPSRLPL